MYPVRALGIHQSLQDVLFTLPRLPPTVRYRQKGGNGSLTFLNLQLSKAGERRMFRGK